MILIVMIALLVVCGYAYANRTTVFFYALTGDGPVLVYRSTMFTRALHQGDDRVVYEQLVKTVRKRISLDSWLKGCDFGVSSKQLEGLPASERSFIFILRYEDVLGKDRSYNGGNK